MDDIYDQATDTEQLFLDVALRNTRAAAVPVAAATGLCLSCDKPVSVGVRWCNRSCCEDWERVNK